MLVIAAIYLFLPIAATVLYSFATTWNTTVLPEGLTLNWYAQLFQDMRFIESFSRSLLLSGGATLLALLVTVPAIFTIMVYAPRLERAIQSLVMASYALPGVIMAVGLIRAYAGKGISMLLIIIGAYVVAMLPFIYQAVSNSLRTINAAVLMEAAQLLGASRLRAFVRIIVPNIMPGILVAGLLSFSMLFGEFVLINMLVGGKFETLQIYLYGVISKSGHMSSAIVVTYFVCMAIISTLLLKLGTTGSTAAIGSVRSTRSAKSTESKRRALR
ncbi:ABC transporter permease [Paenibacillus sp. 481]|uniref:ABC transporter permease n=1 Tax=Paenibacillus sp. 481 TaxID=2835869 RepID=UPI001E5E497D|nr:ABC transporter permease subunit [Paenibacillus sp. 481]UHA75861.1 ABC transporter permease subunit [Paenibacillus sp. 481]